MLSDASPRLSGDCYRGLIPVLSAGGGPAIHHAKLLRAIDTGATEIREGHTGCERPSGWIALEHSDPQYLGGTQVRDSSHRRRCWVTSFYDLNGPETQR